MPIGQLTQVLRDVNPESDPRLLVGPETVDDAGVVLLGEAEGVPGRRHRARADGRLLPAGARRSLPVRRGCGGELALGRVRDGGAAAERAQHRRLPEATSTQDWIREIFRGGFDKVRESGAVIAGGHTVESPEPMFGFAVTGIVERARIDGELGGAAPATCST
jgi:selenide,water dikinase